jgi:hypothetical protein
MKKLLYSLLSVMIGASLSLNAIDLTNALTFRSQACAVALATVGYLAADAVCGSERKKESDLYTLNRILVAHQYNAQGDSGELITINPRAGEYHAGDRLLLRKLFGRPEGITVLRKTINNVRQAVVRWQFLYNNVPYLAAVAFGYATALGVCLLTAKTKA